MIVGTFTGMVMNSAKIYTAAQERSVVDRQAAIGIEIVTGSYISAAGNDGIDIFGSIDDFLATVFIEITPQSAASALAPTIGNQWAIQLTCTILVSRTVWIGCDHQLSGATVDVDTDLCPVVDGVPFQLTERVGGIVPVDTGNKGIITVGYIGDIYPLTAKACPVLVIAACRNTHIIAAIAGTTPHTP